MGRKSFSNGPGHMTKMTVMPIHGNTPLKPCYTHLSTERLFKWLSLENHNLLYGKIKFAP